MTGHLELYNRHPHPLLSHPHPLLSHPHLLLSRWQTMQALHRVVHDLQVGHVRGRGQTWVLCTRFKWRECEFQAFTYGCMNKTWPTSKHIFSPSLSQSSQSTRYSHPLASRWRWSQMCA